MIAASLILSLALTQAVATSEVQADNGSAPVSVAAGPAGKAEASSTSNASEGAASTSEVRPAAAQDSAEPSQASESEPAPRPAPDFLPDASAKAASEDDVAAATTERERGDNMFAAGNMDEAFAAYVTSVKLNPEDGDALNQLGVTLVKLGRLEDSIFVFDRAIAVKPGHATAYYNKGFALKKLSRTDDLIETYRKYVELAPDDSVGYFNLAEGFYVKGTFEEALANYEKFLSMDKKGGKKKNHSEKRVAELKEKLGRKESVGTEKKTVDVIAPSSVLFVTPERTETCRQKTEEGIELRKQGKLREAVAAHQDAVDADPHNVDALFQLGESYAAMEYFQAAVARWQRVLENNPPPSLKSETRDRLDKAYHELERRGVGRDEMKEAGASDKPADADKGEAAAPAGKAIDPAARTAALKGASYYADGNYEEAIRQYDIALAHHPEVSEFYSGRASAWLGSGDATRALADFNNAHKYGEHLALPIFGAAETLLVLKRYDEARKHYEAFLKSTAADGTQEMRKTAKERLEFLDKKKSGKSGGAGSNAAR